MDEQGPMTTGVIQPASRGPRLVIIESPYAGNVETNLDYARQALHDSLIHGEAPLASHLLYTQVLNDKDEVERAAGIAAGLAWVRKADLHAFYTDRGWSKGMLIALTYSLTSGWKFEFRALHGDVKLPPHSFMKDAEWERIMVCPKVRRQG